MDGRQHCQCTFWPPSAQLAEQSFEYYHEAPQGAFVVKAPILAIPLYLDDRILKR
jgi:hypothetical protein